MPMPESRRWRSDLLASDLQLFAGAVVNAREAVAIASDPDEPRWYREASSRGAGEWAHYAATAARSIIRHAREAEDAVHAAAEDSPSLFGPNDKTQGAQNDGE